MPDSSTNSVILTFKVVARVGVCLITTQLYQILLTFSYPPHRSTPIFNNVMLEELVILIKKALSFNGVSIPFLVGM